MGFTASEDTPLEDLGQQARGKQLRTAKIVMILVGVLTILINGIVFMSIENQVAEEFRQANITPSQQQIREVAGIARIAAAVSVGLGIVFLVLAGITNSFPVFATVTALVLFIGSMIGYGVLNPMSLVQGIFIKIVIIVCLAKSIQSALAYKKHQQEMQPQTL